MWVPTVGALGMQGTRRKRGPGGLDAGVAGPWQLSAVLVSCVALGGSSGKAPFGISLWQSPGCDAHPGMTQAFQIHQHSCAPLLPSIPQPPVHLIWRCMLRSNMCHLLAGAVNNWHILSLSSFLCYSDLASHMS